jgi:hypothetical protein
MGEQLDPRQQVSDIYRHLAEARSTFEGGGAIPIVAAVLTAIAGGLTLAGVTLPWGGAMGIWFIHNILLLGIGWILIRREIHKDGRLTLRGRATIQTWMAVSLAIWLVIALLAVRAPGAGAMLGPLLSLLLGLGIFVTGLISESGYSRVVGILLMVFGAGLGLALPPYPAYIAELVVMVACMAAWGLGTWVLGKDES